MHADDFGITLAQAQSLLALSKASDKSNPFQVLAFLRTAPCFTILQAPASFSRKQNNESLATSQFG